MTFQTILTGLTLFNTIAVLWLLFRDRNRFIYGREEYAKKLHIPKEGMVRAVRNAVTGPKGAVLTTPDAEQEETEKRVKKRLFLKKAEKNPLTPLPDGLNPADFGIEDSEYGTAE